MVIFHTEHVYDITKGKHVAYMHWYHKVFNKRNAGID